jgi:hypothetical protein
MGYAINYSSDNEFCITMFHQISLNCRAMSIRQCGHLSIFHTPSSHTCFWTFNPWKVKTNVSSLIIPLNSPTSAFELMKPLDVVLTLNQEKFTRSCLCESPSDLKAMSPFHFMDPKTSWPSKWGILVVKEDPLVYLTMALPICNRSPNWLTRHNLNSSLVWKILAHFPHEDMHSQNSLGGGITM